MRLSRQFQASLFYFLPKGFEHKKVPNAKQMTFTLLEVSVHSRNCCLCCLVSAYFCFVGLFFACEFLCIQNLFVKKIK